MVINSEHNGPKFFSSSTRVDSELQQVAGASNENETSSLYAPNSNPAAARREEEEIRGAQECERQREFRQQVERAIGMPRSLHIPTAPGGC